MRQVALAIALLKRAIKLLDTEAPARDVAESFMREQTRPTPGAKILFAELHRRFLVWAPKEEKSQWSKMKFGRAIRAAGYVTAAKTGNKHHAIGVEWMQ
jgi:hypothetical protein